MIFSAKPRNMKDKNVIAIRKSVDDICDVCTCGGDTDDKCPDIIPDISLASSEAITRNSEIDDDVSEKCNNSLTTPLTAAYSNGINGADGIHHQHQHTTHWRASPPPSPPPNHRTPFL
jgi:hypothetical protein